MGQVSFPQKGKSGEILDNQTSGNPGISKDAKAGLSMGDSFQWEAVNEVTRRLAKSPLSDAVGWAMLAEVAPGREVWFGRIGRDFSFGPATQARAKAAVEARLFGQPFEKQDDERSWSGTCWKMIGGAPEPCGMTEVVA
jgi:hypothetical protein